MITSKLKHRMYGFVPYNLSPIQQGIQYFHAAIEYSLKYGNTAPYKQWSKVDKTAMILNGGTTNNSSKGENLSGMSAIAWELHQNDIPFAVFQEPDLNDATTGIALVVDERIYDREKYPCPFDTNYEQHGRNFKLESYSLEDRLHFVTGSESDKRKYTAWVKSIGGKQNEFLRYFLPKYRLA